jgi:hypothetical protein
MKSPALVMGRRALRWIEKLRASVRVVARIAREPEGSQQGLLIQYVAGSHADTSPYAAAYFNLLGTYAPNPDHDDDELRKAFRELTHDDAPIPDHLDRGTMEAATAYLKRIGYPGEAARIKILYRKLTKALRAITSKSGGNPPHQVSLVLKSALDLEKAVLEAEAAFASNVLSLLSKAPQAKRRASNKGKKSEKTKRIEKLIKEGRSNNEIDRIVSGTNPGAIAQIRYRMKLSNGSKNDTP